MIYPIQSLLFLETGITSKTLMVLDGPSGLSIRQIEREWLEDKLGYSLPNSVGERNYLLARYSLKEFIDYLKRTYGMTELKFGEAHFTLLKED